MIEQFSIWRNFSQMNKPFRGWIAGLRWNRGLRTALFALIGAAPGHASSLLVNHDFSNGLTGWLTIGTVFDTGQTGVLSDQGGNRVVLFQSGAVPAGTPALSLSFDFLNALSNVVPLGTTPDTVFFSSFHGQTEFGSSFDNGAYDTAIVLLDADYRGPTNLAPGMVMSPSPKGAGWTRFTLPLPTTPVVTLGFEFIDGNGIANDSTAAVDNVALEVVPEPAVVGTILGTLGVWLLRRRRSGFSPD
jgi:hypothetical protein